VNSVKACSSKCIRQPLATYSDKMETWSCYINTETTYNHWPWSWLCYVMNTEHVSGGENRAEQSRAKLGWSSKRVSKKGGSGAEHRAVGRGAGIGAVDPKTIYEAHRRLAQQAGGWLDGEIWLKSAGLNSRFKLAPYHFFAGSRCN